jgi:EAL and modified HD-GYP domain-containing signal transduction protein
LGQLPIGDEVKAALISKEGRAGALYQLIISYEKADWKAMSAVATELGIPQAMIAQKYFECVENVNSIWDSLTTTIDQAD